MVLEILTFKYKYTKNFFQKKFQHAYRKLL